MGKRNSTKRFKTPEMVDKEEQRALRRAEREWNKLVGGFTNIEGKFIDMASQQETKEETNDDFGPDDDDDDDLVNTHVCLLNRLDTISNRYEESCKPRAELCKSLRIVSFASDIQQIPIPNEMDWHDDYKTARIGSWAEDAARFRDRCRHLEQLLMTLRGWTRQQ